MDARVFRIAILFAAICALGANRSGNPRGMTPSAGSSRSQHFIVSAPTAEFARQVCEAAEQYRRDLAMEWLGSELPPWQDPCPIYVKAGPQLGAGGATQFTFIGGQPRDWHMEIQGSRERILDSVLPHEITHTVFATHFGRPLPRWADEGACTSVEHVSERTKQDQLLIQFLTTNRGIAFNHMFAMKDYPPDILPLYSQGYSLARYMIARGGKRKFVDYVGDGMQWNNWTAATQKHYGMKSLSELQVTWLDWVRRGSPEIDEPSTRVPNALAGQPPAPRRQLSPNDNRIPATPAPPEPLEVLSGLVPLPSAVWPRSEDAVAHRDAVVPDTNAPTTSTREGWYLRQRDGVLKPTDPQTLESRPAVLPPTSPPSPRKSQPTTAPLRTEQILLEWSRLDRPQENKLR